NGAPDGGNKPCDIYTTYHDYKIYVDADYRIGISSHKELNQDLADGDHIITVGGQRTPYIQYAEKKEGDQSWRFWCANEDDSLSDYTLMLVDDYEDLDLRRTYGGFSDPHIYYGGSNSRYRSDGWIIDKHFVGAAAANYQFSFDNFVIWHWDNDSGGYNETLDFDLGDRKFKSYNAGRDIGVEEFKIYLGKEYSVSTLAENYTVPNDQSQTLGRPLYYIPKGKVLTVAKDAVLSIDGVLLNDGEIVIEDGGLLVVKDGAKIMPLTKYDNNCGTITSKGNIVIGDDALLCGGGVNGIRILGGGVVNFGVMAAESFFVSENYAIDNRETGWVIAGKSPSRESRIRYITDAIANEGATKPTDVKKDFAKIGNFDSTFNIPVNGVYGNTANVSKTGEKAVGSASDPTLSVYTRATPNDAYETVFEDVKLDRVDVRVESDKAIYTAEGKTYTIQNKLVAAAIGRGDRDREAIFTDMWAGALDGAYVQLEPVRAPGMRLALSGGGVDGAKAVVWTANNDMDKWWHIAKAGTVGVNQTYYLDNVKSKGEARGLDISGVNSVSSGAAVQLYNHGDNGNDQRWILVQSSGTQYFFRNAANQNVSLAVVDAAPKNGTAVYVRTNSSYESGQYWNIVNLLTEDSYADAVTLGTAMEFIPQSATGMRMALPSGASAGQGVTIRTSDAANNAQRWRLEPVGTDDLDGVATTFYRVVEMNSGLALSVQGTEIKAGAAVVAANVAAGSGGNMQYWYLTEAGGADKYYVAARGNTGFVLSAPNSQSPASGSALSLAANVNASYQQWEIAGAGEAIAAAETADTSDDPFAGRVFELQPANFPSIQRPAELRVANLGGGNVEIRRNHSDQTALQWVFQKIGDDTVDGQTRPYYQIMPAADKTRALAPEGGTANDDTRVIADAASMNNQAQHWFVTENSDGSYTITPRSNADVALGDKTIGWGWQTAI
ncbi:MAG: RICIN domain-containing protein, partial [Oscillospiraceae bacterium]|nr:RICIN domain-containing protein [Oscillospiraceae bacterium]